MLFSQQSRQKKMAVAAVLGGSLEEKPGFARTLRGDGPDGKEMEESKVENWWPKATRGQTLLSHTSQVTGMRSPNSASKLWLVVCLWEKRARIFEEKSLYVRISSQMQGSSREPYHEDLQIPSSAGEGVLRGTRCAWTKGKNEKKFEKKSKTKYFLSWYYHDIVLMYPRICPKERYPDCKQGQAIPPEGGVRLASTAPRRSPGCLWFGLCQIEGRHA